MKIFRRWPKRVIEGDGDAFRPPPLVAGAKPCTIGHPRIAGLTPQETRVAFHQARESIVRADRTSISNRIAQNGRIRPPGEENSAHQSFSIQ